MGIARSQMYKRQLTLATGPTMCWRHPPGQESAGRRGYAAGGGSDITARLIGQWLSERFSQQFVIENRPGAATNIATGRQGCPRWLHAPPGHWRDAINATLYDKLNFNFIRDIAPVGSVIRVPLVMVVNQSFRSSSLLPRPIRAESILRRAPPEAPTTCPVSYSR